MDDLELLDQYVHGGSESAFAELVRRHINWVYSVCRRQVRDPAMAEDVTQAVFIVLAEKAPILGPETRLTGWLHQTARYAAKDAMRREGRRRKHEVKAARHTVEAAMPVRSDSLLETMGPHLDAALASLSAADREAVVQRFYVGRSFREVGQLLGITEDAAKKRVSRAVERLYGVLKPKAVAPTVGGLATVLTCVGAEAAPPALASTAVAAATTGGAAVPTAIAHGAIKLMAAAKAKVAAGVMTALVVAALGTGALYYAVLPPAPPTVVPAPVVQAPAAPNPPAPPTPAPIATPPVAPIAAPVAVPDDDTIVLEAEPDFRRVIPRRFLRLADDNPALPRFEAALFATSTPAWDRANAQVLVQRDGPSWAVLVQGGELPPRLYCIANNRFMALLDAQNPGGLLLIDNPRLVVEYFAARAADTEGPTLTCDMRLDPRQSRIHIDLASLIEFLQYNPSGNKYDPAHQSVHLGGRTSGGTIFVPPVQQDNQPPINLISVSSAHPRMAVSVRDIRFGVDASNRWVGFDAGRLSGSGMPMRRISADDLQQSLVPAAAFWTNPANVQAATKFAQLINATPQ